MMIGTWCNEWFGIGSSGSTGSDDRRPLAICVRNLPLRSSDTSLKDGLFHEYKKHGKVVTVKVAGTGSERVAIVRFVHLIHQKLICIHQTTILCDAKRISMIPKESIFHFMLFLSNIKRIHKNLKKNRLFQFFFFSFCYCSICILHRISYPFLFLHLYSLFLHPHIPSASHLHLICISSAFHLHFIRIFS